MLAIADSFLLHPNTFCSVWLGKKSFNLHELLAFFFVAYLFFLEKGNVWINMGYKFLEIFYGIARTDLWIIPIEVLKYPNPWEIWHKTAPGIYNSTCQVSNLSCYNRIQEYLGSGQFGTVNRGVWSLSPSSSSSGVEVAVKSLEGESTEEERVKFLQEAAIMGQFKHPNIIRIAGAITTSDPVSVLN